MGHEGIILVNSPISTFQQSLTHSALFKRCSSSTVYILWVFPILWSAWNVGGDHQEKFKVLIKSKFNAITPTYCHGSMSMSPDPLRQLHVLWHDSHPFSMDCTEVGVLKQPNNISLHPLLQGREGCCLDTEGGGILQHQTPGKSLERKATY